MLMASPEASSAMGCVRAGAPEERSFMGIRNSTGRNRAISALFNSRLGLWITLDSGRRTVAAMKVYRFWARAPVEIRIAGKPATISPYGRSDVSVDDARRNAIERARSIERKIAGEAVLEDYTVDIREEIVLEIDAHNVVTRNRYGARVLNSDSVAIIDVDQHRAGFLEALGFRKRDNKAAIFEDLEKLARRPEYAQLGFRAYETAQGARVIVTGAYIDPASAQGAALFDRSHADRTFPKLCVKQKCYR